MADMARGPFAALLRDFRVRANLTQEALSGRAGISTQAISLLERGSRQPRPDTIEKLARGLDLTPIEREKLVAAGHASDGLPARGSARPAVAALLAGIRVPVGRRPRAAASALLLAVVAAGSLGWWQFHESQTRASGLVGAQAADWLSANQEIGPLQTQQIVYQTLPATFRGTVESNLPHDVVPIISYEIATRHVLSYVRSVTRSIILIYRHDPETTLSASAFVSGFEGQSRLIRSAGNPDVRVAMAAWIARYQPDVDAQATNCEYIPPPSFVDYYLAEVYDHYLLGIAATAGGGFVAWQRCTAGLGRPRGLAAYALGLGTPDGRTCHPESDRTRVLRDDMAYLRANLPDLQILEYTWDMDVNSQCSTSWQFPAGSSTADVWRAIADRRLAF